MSNNISLLQKTSYYAFSLAVAAICFLSSPVQAMDQAPKPSSEWEKTIKKVNDKFYVGRFSRNAKNFWIVMERVDNTTLPYWKKYAEIQDKYSLIETAKKVDKNYSGAGSTHFKGVLDEFNITKNEVWVAYVTTNSKNGGKQPIPKTLPEINQFVKDYSDDKVINRDTNFAGDILMSMTVTSSPKALFTSHMGISASIEATLNPQKEKGISMYLHAFCAQVMLIRNPNRQYMINAPVPIVEKFLMENLPNGSVFVGTREHPGNKGYHTIMDYPSLISTDGTSGWIDNKLVIFDRNNLSRPWKTILKGDLDYNWVFTTMFGPDLNRYAVVVLSALANSKPLDPITSWSNTKVNEPQLIETPAKITSDQDNIKKINDNFYVGKITVGNKPIWLVIERLNANNKAFWQKFSAVQTDYYLEEMAKKIYKKYSGAGSNYFAEILNEFDFTSNEMWIAYATYNSKNGGRQPLPKSQTDIANFVKNYSAEMVKNRDINFAGDIIQYMAVITSPKALVTSHMGLAISLEAALNLQVKKGISTYLHAFCAKVMLLRNPLRKYMIDLPLPIFEGFFLKNLPEGTVFIGSREFKGNPLYHKKFGYPTLVSTDGINGAINQKMIIFDKNDPSRPWLTINKGDPNYNWILSSGFTPQATRHLLVDLSALAAIKEMDPIDTWPR